MLKAFAILWIATLAAAQTEAPDPAFEVASVKRFRPQIRPGIRAIPRTDPAPSRPQISGTRVSMSGNLVRLVAAAYGLEIFQVSQGRDSAEWASSDVYQIDARAPGFAIPTVVQVRGMMQTLLAERFQLKVSRRNEMLPVYNLVVGPGGAKLKPSAATDPPLTRDEGGAAGEMHLRCVDLSMADLVELVRRQFDHPLVDKTGLTGGFDFSLDSIAQLSLPDAAPGPPIVASLREQLGLRVVPTKEQVGILVIDYAERPRPN